MAGFFPALLRTPQTDLDFQHLPQQCLQVPPPPGAACGRPPSDRRSAPSAADQTARPLPPVAPHACSRRTPDRPRDGTGIRGCELGWAAPPSLDDGAGCRWSAPARLAPLGYVRSACIAPATPPEPHRLARRPPAAGACPGGRAARPLSGGSSSDGPAVAVPLRVHRRTAAWRSWWNSVGAVPVAAPDPRSASRRRRFAASSRRSAQPARLTVAAIAPLRDASARSRGTTPPGPALDAVGNAKLDAGESTASKHLDCQMFRPLSSVFWPSGSLPT